MVRYLKSTYARQFSRRNNLSALLVKDNAVACNLQLPRVQILDEEKRLSVALLLQHATATLSDRMNKIWTDDYFSLFFLRLRDIRALGGKSDTPLDIRALNKIDDSSSHCFLKKLMNSTEHCFMNEHMRCSAQLLQAKLISGEQVKQKLSNSLYDQQQT